MALDPDRPEQDVQRGIGGPLLVGVAGLTILAAEYLELDFARGTVLAARTGWALLVAAVCWGFVRRLRRL